MAINVDTVYKTVLLILNQQQRGYMTPDEFNRVGTQVQLGIFENYANDLNQQMRVPQNDTEYGNRFKNTATKIDIFKKIRTATYNNVGGYYELPTAVDTPLITPQAFTGNGVLTAFTLVAPWTTLLGSIDSQVKITVAGVEVFNWTYDNQSLTVTFTTPPANAAAISISLYAMDFYRLGTVIYNDVTEIQLMDRNEWYLIKKAPLVAPTTTYPACLFEDEKIYIYPTTIVPGLSTNNTSPIQVSYIKKPANILWSSTPGSVGQLLYSSANSIQFELHPSEQTNVILQVLSYAGVILQDPNIVQMAAQQVQQEQMNDKS